MTPLLKAKHVHAEAWEALRDLLAPRRDVTREHQELLRVLMRMGELALEACEGTSTKRAIRMLTRTAAAVRRFLLLHTAHHTRGEA